MNNLNKIIWDDFTKKVSVDRFKAFAAGKVSLNFKLGKYIFQYSTILETIKSKFENRNRFI